MHKSVYKLMGGFRRFKGKYFQQDEFAQSIYGKLSTSGQTPKTLLIGCSDSRVDPAILFGVEPGELFVVRNVANLVPPCETSANGFHGTSSALEFAVENLKVENVIILGHRQCGGIRALMRGPVKNNNSFVSQWMSIAEGARDQVLRAYPDADEATQCRHAEMASLVISLQNVNSFPFVQSAIADRQMSVIAVYFDLELGQLWAFDDAVQQFRQLEI